MMWINPGTDHAADVCYFCVNSMFGINCKNSIGMTYTPTLYAALPVEHTENSPTTQVYQQTEDEAMGNDENTIDEDELTEYVEEGITQKNIKSPKIQKK